MWQMQLAAHWMGAGVLGRAAGPVPPGVSHLSYPVAPLFYALGFMVLLFGMAMTVLLWLLRVGRELDAAAREFRDRAERLRGGTGE